MKSFWYRDYEISVYHHGGTNWCITANGQDPFSGYNAWYNIEWEGPRKWWHGGHHHTRTFEEALENTLELLDLRSMRQAKAKEYEKLMEARLSLAEELLP